LIAVLIASAFPAVAAGKVDDELVTLLSGYRHAVACQKLGYAFSPADVEQLRVLGIKRAKRLPAAIVKATEALVKSYPDSSRTRKRCEAMRYVVIPAFVPALEDWRSSPKD
jgi:hypothetical protein